METTNRNRVTGELLALRDAEWLRLREEGMSIADLAEEAGMSVRHIKRALSRARKAEEARLNGTDDDLATTADDAESTEPASAAPLKPWWLELVPIFPVGHFTPSSECPHKGPIPEGSLLCCMVCSASGVDKHPALVRDPATDPRPEPKTRLKRHDGEAGLKAYPADAGPKSETRRQRRSSVFKTGESPANTNHAA
jgi:hypothetical protein